jgi:hypothetical protein
MFMTISLFLKLWCWLRLSERGFQRFEVRVASSRCAADEFQMHGILPEHGVEQIRCGLAPGTPQ